MISLSWHRAKRQAPRASRDLPPANHDRRHILLAPSNPSAAARRHRLGASRLDGPRAGTRYKVASVKREAGCTCPDHETNGATCKHVMALQSDRPYPPLRSHRDARPRPRNQPAPPPPAKALADLTKRIHSAPPVAAPPAEKPDPLTRARRRQPRQPSRHPHAHTACFPRFAVRHRLPPRCSAHITQLQGAQS